MTFVRRHTLGLLALMALWPVGAMGQTGRVTLDVDRHIAKVGEPLQVKVSIVVEGRGGYDRFIPPTFGAGFQVSGGGMTTQNVEIINWQVRRREGHVYNVVPLRPGAHTIGPAAIIVKGRRMTSGRVTIQVRGSAAAGAARVPEGAGQPDAGAPEPGFPVERANERVFLAAVVSPRKVVQGQQVLVTWYLFTQSDVLGFRNTKQPSTDGFWAEDLRSPRRLVFDRRMLGNRLFYAAVIARKALFPQKTGTLTIGPLTARVRTLDHFSSAAKDKKSEAVTIEVQPLPTQGKPGNFPDDNVGQFDIAASVDRPRIKAGEGVTLRVVVSGRGNLRKVQPPNLDDSGLKGFKVYKPKVEDRLALEDGVGGEKVLEYLLLPVRAGQLTIPALSLDYYDPSEGKYKQAKTEPLRLMVTGKMPVGTMPGDPAAKNVIGPTIRPPRPARPLTHQEVGVSLVMRVLFLVLAGSPVAFVLLWTGGERLRARLRQETAGSMRRAAGRRTRGHLRQAEQYAQQEDIAGFHAEVNAGIRSVLNHRLGVSVEGLTRPELAQTMEQAGFPAGLIDEVGDQLDACDVARFAPGAAGGAAAMSQTLKVTRKLLRRLGTVSIRGGVR